MKRELKLLLPFILAPVTFTAIILLIKFACWIFGMEPNAEGVAFIISTSTVLSALSALLYHGEINRYS